jgi:glycosyltransferase involved in cell wall biosynthesis
VVEINWQSTMKIVIDARESGTSTGRYVDKLIEHLHALKPNIEFLILTKTPRVEFLKKIAPDFQVKKSDIKEFTFAEQYSLVWQLYGIKNDLVHFTMTQQPVLYFGNKVTTVHDLTTAYFRNPAKNRAVFWIKQRVYRWVIRKDAQKSTQFVVPSNYVKAQLAEFAGVNPDKITVTYEAADKITAKAEPLKGLERNNFIMYVGRPLPHKNLGRLIEAFEFVRQTHPNLKLVLVGKKDTLYDRIEAKVKKRGTRGVVFTGFASEGQLRWLYENTAAYVFPSLSEGFGLPALEAMVHGAPVISSNTSCLPEIYGAAALYFNPLDVQEMARKISQVVDDEKLSKKLSMAGVNHANKYSWLKTAEQTLEVYRKATKNT